MILRALLLFLITALPLHAEQVVLSMNRDQISINTRFDGSDLLIFGAVKRETSINQDDPLQVIIAVQGPKKPVTIRRKAHRFGIWINSDSVDIDLAPSFYAISTSGPFEEILSSVEDLRHKVSIPRAIRSVGAPMNVKDSQSFTDALIRIRTKNNLYQLNENTVTFDEQTLFKTAIKLPANLTEGNYNTRIFLTRGGKVVSSYETALDVRRVGMEAFLYNLSRQKPLVYGILAIAIAIFAGWGASAAIQALRRN